MCGIAGIIYRDGTRDVGRDMTRMLQSMKHRGPDSTGYALYGQPHDGQVVMRYTLADANTPRDFEFDNRIQRHQTQVVTRL
jgi:glutamate synthase domain-containing protein 1